MNPAEKCTNTWCAHVSTWQWSNAAAVGPNKLDIVQTMRLWYVEMWVDASAASDAALHYITAAKRNGCGIWDWRHTSTAHTPAVINRRWLSRIYSCVANRKISNVNRFIGKWKFRTNLCRGSCRWHILHHSRVTKLLAWVAYLADTKRLKLSR